MKAQIEGREVTTDDIGSPVTYIPRHTDGDAKIQVIDTFTHTQSEFKTIDSIIYSKYGADVRHFPNLHKILTDFITVDYHQLHELRRDLAADRMYHSSLNRVKHDAFNNRKYIPLTNPTWTI
jgi:hypothetical protein